MKKARKEPGKKRREETKKLNDTMRGARIPGTKVVPDGKTKSSTRAALKQKTISLIRNG